MTRNDTMDEDGLTPLEQAIAKRLFQHCQDSFGNLTIQEDPRNVALWLRDLVQEAQADAWDEALVFAEEFVGNARNYPNPYRDEAP